MGTAVRRSGPSGSWQAATRLGRRGERQQRVAPAVRRRARVRRATLGAHPQGPGRLAPHDHAVVALRRARAALEAEAGVEAGEALHVGERRRPPLLVADQQQRHLGVVLRARRQRAHHAEREHDAALHVDRARPDELVAVALERAMRRVRDDRVEVAEQQDPPRARARDPREHVLGVAGRGAGQALERDGVGQQRGADGSALLRAALVARGRGDADERLQLALGAPPDLMRAPRDPVIHGPGR